MASTLLESPHESTGLGDVLADAAMTAAVQLESGPAQPAENSTTPGSIAAYYSLTFPNFTYYLQTLDVTIGRRLVSAGPSEDGAKSVDVDLGPLKSVSRLHAKITYDDEDERWVLDIYGRNGAWVDGIWFGPGCRVPLESRSQIQIASRSFSFILPPTDPPDESPLTSSPTSTTRPRSPSLDATSLSPASSPVSVHSPTPLDPEHAAEPEIVQPSKPKLIRKRAASDSDHDIHVSPVPPQESKPLPAPEPDVELDPEPEAELEPEPEPELEPKQVPAPKPAPAKGAKAAASKSKPKAKPTPAPTKPPPVEPPETTDLAPAAPPSLPKPAPYVRLPGQPEPQKPAATLSQLCYRAIKALDGRATLQGILCWIMDTYEWYRAHAGEKWESSVRHNLSSNAAFVKSQRNSNEPGKGAFWCIDPNHIATFEAVEARLNAGPSTKPGKGKAGGKTPTTSDAAPAAPKVKKEPPVNAAVPVLVAVPILHPGVVPPGAQASKGLKPPPPPLMSTRPLASPFTTKPLAAKPIASPFTTRPLLHKAGSAAQASPVARQAVPAQIPPPIKQETVSAPIPSTSALPAVALSPAASAPSDSALHVPIVVGPLPASYPLAEGAEPPPIVLHEGRLILAPKAFAHLSPDEIKEFEKLGAQKALAALQVHVVKFLKEQMRLRGRGRGRGRGAPGRGAAVGRAPPKTPADASAAPAPDRTTADAASTPDVAMRDVGAAETPEESTAPRSQSQVRPRSNSAEVADIPAPKRARVDSTVV